MGVGRLRFNFGRTFFLTLNPSLAISVLFAVCGLVFLGGLLIPRADGLLIGSDGVNYFLVLRSLVLDGDLNLTNDYALLNLTNPTGTAAPLYPVGMAICWLPFYLVAHLGSWLGRVAGLPISPDGVNGLYQFMVCLGTMFYGLVGLVLMYLLAREFFEKGISLLAVALLWFGWNIIYYLVVENSMSHCVAMAISSALISWWRFYPRKESFFYWLGMGALVGFGPMVRPQDALFGLIPLLSLIHQLGTKLRQKDFQVARRLGLGGVWLLVGAVLAYTPQAAASWRSYGKLALSGQSEQFSWGEPKIFEALFSTRHGLFTWHFIVLLAVVGLWFLAKKDPVYTVILAVAFLAQLYVVGAWNMWWQGGGFGGRVFISCAPVFGLGLAALLDRLYRWRGAWPLALLTGLTLAWNFLFLVQYRFRFISMSDALTWQQLTVDKITMVFQIVGRVLKRS